MLVEMGHDVLVHGRSPQKLTQLEKELSAIAKGSTVEMYKANLSSLTEVKSLAKSVAEKHTSLDVLINNAGVFGVPKIMTDEGLDARFAVNTIAPYLLPFSIFLFPPLKNKKGIILK